MAAPDLSFIKTGTAAYRPADSITEEYDKKIKVGQVVHGNFRKMRNPKFHRKFFALLQLGFEYWEPGNVNSKYGVPEKNFDRFRKDITILAGYYNTVVRLDGSVRIQADSISFANMDEDTFESLYNNVITVLMKHIDMLRDMGKEEINRIINEILRFA